MIADDLSGGSGETKVDPHTWRLLRLHAETAGSDGTTDSTEMEALQPPEWVKEHDARVGARVPMPLELREMGLPQDLLGEVVANERCPEIQPGRGRVVLATVNHVNTDVLELTIANERGQQELVRPTALHKFYSADRQEWITASALGIGEHLAGAREN